MPWVSAWLCGVGGGGGRVRRLGKAQARVSQARRVVRGKWWCAPFSRKVFSRCGGGARASVVARPGMVKPEGAAVGSGARQQCACV